jgi:hypoxanthine phosphoribosyltransferase
MFSYSDLHMLIQQNLWKIPEGIDLVIGIPRSGLMPASHIATSLNLPLQTLSDVSKKISTKQLFTIRGIREVETPKHVLVVDDTSNTGLRLSQAVTLINKRWGSVQITTLVMCSAQNSSFVPDIAFSSSTTPRIFAWNMFNHDEMTSRIAIDLDGILCIDPSQDQNDDGENYRNFLREAKVKIQPRKQVKAIVTGRLEKYRPETEAWLFANSISYLDLFMNDAPSANYRRTEKFQKEGLLIDQISEFKSRVLSSLTPPLFVESNLDQAFNIHKITGVNTYAFDHDRLFGSGNFET